jgi:hypothetical protein
MVVSFNKAGKLSMRGAFHQPAHCLFASSKRVISSIAVPRTGTDTWKEYDPRDAEAEAVIDGREMVPSWFFDENTTLTY